MPSGSQFKAFDASLDLTSAPLLDKINFLRKVGEMLHSVLNRNAITIIKAEKLFDNVATRLKKDRDKYRVVHM